MLARSEKPAGAFRRARPYALLVLLCLLLYAPGIARIPPLDRDEARFAQATRQMLQSGDFIRIRFQNEARNNKPVLIYWLQAASVDLFSNAESTAIWPYRLPSALGAGFAVVLIFAFGTRLFAGEPSAGRGAFLAAVLMASALGLVVEAHIAKTDACLLAATVAAEGALALIYVGARGGPETGPGVALLFWVAQAFAILLKGPIAPVIALLTAGALSIADRDLSWLKKLYPLRGFLLLFVIVAPWFVAIERATDGRFLVGSVGHDLLPKLLGGEESHGAPPGTYLLFAPAYFWPGSLYIVPALIEGWRRRRAPPDRFFLAWLIPAWILFELVPTKLPQYVLPLYPALALLAGRALADGFPPVLPRIAGIGDGAVKALWGTATLALAALFVALPIDFGSGVKILAILAAALLVGLAAALFRAPRRFLLVPALAFVFALGAGEIVVPGLDRLWLSRSAAALVAAHPAKPETPIISVGYNEPSLVFLLGTKARLLLPSFAAQALRGGGHALVTGREEKAFAAALAARGLHALALGRVGGLDYSTGRRLTLTLYAVDR